VDIPDPGSAQVVEHPSYHIAQRDNLLPQSAETHQEIAGKKNRSHCRSWSKVNLEIGFVPTACAPLLAKEKASPSMV